MSENTSVETSPSSDGSTETEGVEVEGSEVQDTVDQEAELAQFMNVDKDPDETETLDKELAEAGVEQEDAEEKLADEKVEDKKDEPKKFKVKVDGQEAEVDEAELVRGYQRAQAANKKFEEAANLQKSMAAFVEQLKKDPISILTDARIGVNFRQIAEEYLIEQLKYEQMPAEQKELVEAKKKLSAYEQQQEQAKKESEAKQLEQLTTQYQEAIDEQFSASISKIGLPKTERTISLMADLAMKAEETNTPWSPDTVAEAVKRFLAQEKAEFLKTLTPEELKQYVGNDKVNALRQQDIKAMKEKQGIKKPVLTAQSQARKNQNKRHYLSEDDLEEKVGKAVGRIK